MAEGELQSRSWQDTGAIKGMGRTGETYIGNGKEVRGRRGIKE